MVLHHRPAGGWLALLCVLPLAARALNPAPWTPPAQSPSQVAAFQRAAAAAKTASAAATPALLAALALPGVKTALDGCGASELAALPAQQLLDRVDAEVAVTETVHGWPNLGFENELGPDSEFLYNLWQIPLLAPAAGAALSSGEGHDCYALSYILRVNASVCSEFGWANSKPGYGLPQLPACTWQSSSSMCTSTAAAGLEVVETGLYGFQKFKVRGTPQNFEEASSRMVYAAFNLQRLDTGSSGVFGGIGMVFRPSYIRNMTQLAPTDTGLYAGCLLQADPGMVEPSGFAICSEERNATACNSRINCDWVATGGGTPPGGTPNETHVCKDVVCPHWETKAECSKYSTIGCTWHILRHTCEQITEQAATATAANSHTIATIEQPHSAHPGHMQGRRLGHDDGAPFPTPPTLGCGAWGGPPFPVGTLDDFHHLFLPNAKAWAHENATVGPKSQAELGSRLCRLFNPSATEVSVSCVAPACRIQLQLISSLALHAFEFQKDADDNVAHYACVHSSTYYTFCAAAAWSRRALVRYGTGRQQWAALPYIRTL
jgi:hypothetical protein